MHPTGSDRDESRATAPRSHVKGVVLLLSVGVTAVIVVALFAAGLTSGTSAAARYVPRALPGTPSSVSVAPACRDRTIDGREVVPPLVKSNASPSSSITSQVGLLRQPATAADRVNLRWFDRWPYEAITVYVRYIRVVEGPQGARIAILPARICSLPHPFPPPKHVRLVPTLVLLMQVLSSPRPYRPTVLVGTATNIGNGQANGYLDNPVPQGKTGLLLTVVPSSVARVVFHFPGHPSSATVAIHGNVGIANPTPQLFPTSATWYAANGRVIRTLHPVSIY